jgi:hypothetical protein
MPGTSPGMTGGEGIALQLLPGVPAFAGTTESNDEEKRPRLSLGPFSQAE